MLVQYVKSLVQADQVVTFSFVCGVAWGLMHTSFFYYCLLERLLRFGENRLQPSTELVSPHVSAEPHLTAFIESHWWHRCCFNLFEKCHSFRKKIDNFAQKLTFINADFNVYYFSSIEQKYFINSNIIAYLINFYVVCRFYLGCRNDTF